MSPMRFLHDLFFTVFPRILWRKWHVLGRKFLRCGENVFCLVAIG